MCMYMQNCEDFTQRPGFQDTMVNYSTFEYNVYDGSIFNGVLVGERAQYILTAVLEQQQLVQQVTIRMLREL